MIGDVPVCELDVRRFARLSPEGRFMVGVLIDTWRRDGVDSTLCEAIRQVAEVERRRVEREQG